MHWNGYNIAITVSSPFHSGFISYALTSARVLRPRKSDSPLIDENKFESPEAIAMCRTRAFIESSPYYVSGSGTSSFL